MRIIRQFCRGNNVAEKGSSGGKMDPCRTGVMQREQKLTCSGAIDIKLFKPACLFVYMYAPSME